MAIELSFSAGLGLEKPNSDRDRGETFFPNSGSDLDSDETFQISRNVGLDIDEIVCLLDSQLCLKLRVISVKVDECQQFCFNLTFCRVFNFVCRVGCICWWYLLVVSCQVSVLHINQRGGFLFVKFTCGEVGWYYRYSCQASQLVSLHAGQQASLCCSLHSLHCSMFTVSLHIWTKVI